MKKDLFCTYCGGVLSRRFIYGQNRLVCCQCSEVAWENPVPASACIVFDNNKILLVKRSVEPQFGKWCLPGGFHEVDETIRESALRELREETGLEGTIEGIVDVYNQLDATYPNVLLVAFYVSVPKPIGIITVNDDADDYVFYKEDELPEIAFDSHRHFIDLAFRRLKNRE
jgi:ADP-ribose pyrophosphatase YjhB (NUDIX family)